MTARSAGGYSPGTLGVAPTAGPGPAVGTSDATAGDHKARWKPDENVPACERCSQQFTLIRRRHHCRRCGGVYCDACCASRARLPGFAEPQRVCQICRAIAPGAGLGQGDAGLAPGERDRKILFLEPEITAGAGSSGVVSSGGRLIDAVSTYGLSLAAASGAGSYAPGPATPSRGAGAVGSVYGAGPDEGAQNAAARRFTVTRGYVVYSLMLVDAAEHHATADMLPPLLTVGVSAFVLAFDVSERKWFDQLPLLRERILDCGGHSRTLALVGLVRTDATGVPKERAVPRERAEERAQQWDALYREIAVTSRDAVKDLIEALLADISRRDGY